jgi:hypothetical protein
MAGTGVAAVSPRAVYPLAVFGQLARREGHHFRTWRRKFGCPNPSCEQQRREAGARGLRWLGRQEIRESLDPQDWSRVSGYRLTRIELGRELIPLPDLPDGTLSFGLPESVRRQPPMPGAPVLTPLHRAVPVLTSVGAGAQVGRHASSRVRGGPGQYWSLALSEDRAERPFVLTCPDCRERCRVDGSLPDAELRDQTSIALDALRNPR